MTSTGCGVLIMARTHDARVRRDGKDTGEAAAADWPSWLWRRPSSDGARCGARDFVRTAPDAVGCPTAVLHVPPESRGRTGALLERGWRSMDSAHRVGSQWGNSSRGVEGDGEAQTCVCGGEGAHARGLLAGRARSNWRRSAGGFLPTHQQECSPARDADRGARTGRGSGRAARYFKFNSYQLFIINERQPNRLKSNCELKSLLRECAT